jgi:hypothetical protein
MGSYPTGGENMTKLDISSGKYTELGKNGAAVVPFLKVFLILLQRPVM